MNREEVARVVEQLPREDQIWLMNQIIWRFWPQFQGKAVAFYDPTETWDDWDDKELDEYYRKKWEKAKERQERLQAGRRGDR
ncbi:hypothetical protein E308F_10770 [Moorella sp. E308F]|jgi:hypothetical protein|uniref:hypothetical protein n=1 Tax=Moorella sp. E308F TaxID=2572682 RepID=UPI0010FFAA5C|nr:hypothetical protein [Moorella sp. E308F]MDN5348563.1 hypothetical protein [Clostridia bacterium]GEA14833.1 hypothetical protein E308F_10770 [Moorella sp. E308F]